MKPKLAAFGAGALFALGLAVSGMVRPSKVAGFLDLAGAWDASLALVMVGAIGVTCVAFRLVRRRASPIFEARFELPTRTDIEPRLVVGAALFGVGWGLGGFCPGPGLVAAGGGSTSALVFLVGMTAGAMLEHATARAMDAGSDEKGHDAHAHGDDAHAHSDDAARPTST
jgi:uncharacterized membrane protein YedE/YeeE